MSVNGPPYYLSLARRFLERSQPSFPDKSWLADMLLGAWSIEQRKPEKAREMVEEVLEALESGNIPLDKNAEVAISHIKIWLGKQ